MKEHVRIESPLGFQKEHIQSLLDDVEVVEKSAWPQELQATREKFASRLDLFPGGFLVAKVDGVIKGVSTSQITIFPSSANTWDELTDYGFMKRSHVPNGNALYIVSIGVSKDAQGMGLGGMLVEAQKDFAKRKKLSTVFLGARMPGYVEHCRTHEPISADDYLKLRNAKGEILDPEIRFYIRHGFAIEKVVAHFEPDVESADYGVVMVWNVR